MSVTTEPIGFYSSGYIPIGNVVVFGGGTHPIPLKNANFSPPQKKKFLGKLLHIKLAAPEILNFYLFFLITSWGKAPRG